MNIEINLSKNYDFNRNIGNIYNKHKNISILIVKIRSKIREIRGRVHSCPLLFLFINHIIFM